MVVASLVAGACSHGQQHTQAPKTPRNSTSVARSTVSADPTGNRSLAAVRQAVMAARFYSYRAGTTSTARDGSSQTTTFVGRVVTPDRVTYQATSGRRRFEIIRIGATSYRRDHGGPWRALPHAKTPPPAPTGTLVAVLDHLGDVHGTASGITGTLTPKDADRAGLASGPGVTGPVGVSLTRDSSGRVVHFEAVIKINSARTEATVRTYTDFADIDTPSQIAAPI